MAPSPLSALGLLPLGFMRRNGGKGSANTALTAGAATATPTSYLTAINTTLANGSFSAGKNGTIDQWESVGNVATALVAASQAVTLGESTTAQAPNAHLAQAFVLSAQDRFSPAAPPNSPRPHATIRRMTPEQYVQQKAAASGSSFYYAFLFLPKERRAAITAFYAFCREIDDVVDEVTDPGVAHTKLAWWQSEVAKSFAGTPTHPVMKALMPLAATYNIEARHLQAVIEGCQMDLAQNRYLDFPALKKYCHLVAGIVGEVAAGIFGQTDPATTTYAHKLGLAFQLTNIIRDVGEDSRRGRIYLPVSELQQFDVKAHEILKRQYSERFTALMTFQTERALALYDEAMALLPEADRRAQKPGLMMASIYRTLLREIAADNYQVLHQRVSLTPLRKFWLAWKTQAFGKVV